jgi:hypothetical protein
MAFIPGDGFHGESGTKGSQSHGSPAGENALGQVDPRRGGYCRVFFPGTGEFAAFEIRLTDQQCAIDPDRDWALQGFQAGGVLQASAIR